MDAVAPAKAILSGEHAVVYGAPALAVAVPRYARCRAVRGKGEAVSLRLADLGVERRLSCSELSERALRCRQRHHDFLQGRGPVDAILPSEGDLLLCALAALDGAEASLKGLEITIASDIPPGAGMGSSAATVAALLQAVAATLELPLAPDTLLAHTRAAETLQHGRSSGIDPAVCCAGGAIRYRQGLLEPVSLNLDHHWFMADSGRPAVSTGACVTQVRHHFGDSTIWADFSAVTAELEGAIGAGDCDGIIQALRRNHRLLCTLGVVPDPVRRFVEQVERSGGAAKVSGAGAVAGDGGGLLLVYHPGRTTALRDVTFQLTPLEIDGHGARIRD